MKALSPMSDILSSPSVRPSSTARALLLAGVAAFSVPQAALAADVQLEDPNTALESLYEDEDANYEDDIIVTAPRLSGQLDTSIRPVVELDEAAIASYGASSISELLEALETQTRSGRGRGGRPIMLVNGRRTSGFDSIRNIPPEAIAKVEIFPEEVALQYGYSATERVVNFVLKPNFRQISVELEGGVPTAGGRFQSEIEPTFIAISETGRLNINAGWEHEGLLLESERDVTPTSGLPEESFARSLLSASDTYVVDGTIVRNLDRVTDATLSVRFDQTDSLGLLGLARDGSGDARRREARNQNFTTSGSFNGMVGSWRWSVTGNYGDSDTRTFTERDSGARERTDSSQQSFGANANISGTITEAWAGPIRTSVTAGYTGLRFDSRAERSNGVTETDLARDTPSVFGSLTIPLLDPEYDIGNIGRLTLTLNAKAEKPSDFSSLTSWGSSLNWGVTDRLSLLASYNSDEEAPSVSQLGAAPLTTDAVTYYDFATGQTVEITTITGGNPNLLAAKRRDMKFGINWEAPFIDGLRLSADYNRNRSDNTANSFPLLTPEIEAAFGDRVTREDGVLVGLDQRPVNFYRSENSQIRWGFNFGKSFGQNEAGAAAGRDGGGEGRRARGDGVSPPREPGADGDRSAGAGRRAGGASARDGAAPAGNASSASPAAEGGSSPEAMRGPRGEDAGSGTARSGGRGMGGGRGFGRRGMGGGAQNGGRWQTSFYHTIKLTDRVIIAPGVPELDMLNGSATGSGGGSNRHLFELDGGLFYKGFGTRLSAKYDSGSTVVGGANGDLTFHDLATFNLRVFADFNQMPKVTEDVPFLKNSRLRLSVNNIFDAQRKITDGSGVVPLNYQPGYLDPLGRYVELSWRKSF